MSQIVWVLPVFSTIATHNVSWAWIIAACFLPVSFGWAAGDVSLAAYIQSSLSEMNIRETGVSPLGAVMAFLYSAYVIINAILSSVLGRVIDNDYITTGNIYNALVEVGGIQYSVGCGIIFLSTFIPRGAFAINPKPTGDLKTPEDSDEEEPLNGAVLRQGGSHQHLDKQGESGRGGEVEHIERNNV